MPDGPQLLANVSADRRDGKKLVHADVRGEVNLQNAPKLREQLLALDEKHEPDVLELDLSGVPYMDSSALAVLIEALKKVRGHDGVVRLVGPTQRVTAMMKISRVDQLFETV